MHNGLRHKQRGATFLGMVTIGSILALGVYAGIRLVPIYLDYMAIVRAMTDISKSNAGATAGELKKALNARWNIDYISSIQPNEIEIKPVAGGLEMRANYEARAPFVGNVFLVVEFDSAVVVGGGAQ